jgi:hypothetical protein
MQTDRTHRRGKRRPTARTLICTLAGLMVTQGAALADEPRMPDETPAPLCCGVPPADEVTADQIFGHWVVTKSSIGAPLRSGERVEFRRDGTLGTAHGPCRFAVLRAELAVTCAGRSQSGEVSFVDDTKLIWRLDGREMMFVAPAD